MPDPPIDVEPFQRVSYQLTLDQRIDLCVLIARYQGHHDLKRGDKKKISEALNVSDTAVSKFAKRLKDGEPASQVVKSRKVGNSNSFSHDNDKLLAKLEELKPEERGTMRCLSEHLGVSLHKIYDMVRDGLIRCNRRNLKPRLSPAHRVARLQWANEHIDDNGKVDDMYDYVHIDEKWFYVHHDGSKIYVTAAEDAPEDFHVQHKSHIRKVMFFAAVARPRPIGRRDWWDGKLGCWAFTDTVVAQRTSKNRPKGALEVKTIPADKKSVEKMMVRLSKAIEEKWPPGHSHRTIKVQMDNASPHINENNEAWKKAREGQSLKIELVRQPAQSPDLNVLDLGIWTSIQALQRKKPIMHTNFELLRGIQKCYAEVPLTKIDSCFVTLQNMLKEVKEAAGGNKFKTPRKRKYSPPESDDEMAFAPSDSETETEDEMECVDVDDDEDMKPPPLRKPRLCKVMANLKISETAGRV